MEKKNMAKREQVKKALGLDDELMDLLAPGEELNAGLIKELGVFKAEIETEFARGKRSDTSWEGVALYLAIKIQKQFALLKKLLAELDHIIPGLPKPDENGVFDPNNDEYFKHYDDIDVIEFGYPLIDTKYNFNKSQESFNKLIERLKKEVNEDDGSGG